MPKAMARERVAPRREGSQGAHTCKVWAAANTRRGRQASATQRGAGACQHAPRTRKGGAGWCLPEPAPMLRPCALPTCLLCRATTLTRSCVRAQTRASHPPQGAQRISSHQRGGTEMSRSAGQARGTSPPRCHPAPRPRRSHLHQVIDGGRALVRVELEAIRHQCLALAVLHLEEHRVPQPRGRARRRATRGVSLRR